MKLTLKQSKPSNKEKSSIEQIGDIIDVSKIKEKKSVFEEMFGWVVKPCNALGEQSGQHLHDKKKRANYLYENQNVTIKQQSCQSVNQSPQHLFPSLPLFNPSQQKEHSYFLTTQLQQFIHSQCTNRFHRINKNYQQSCEFMLQVLQSVGYVMAHVSLIKQKERKISFPQILFTRFIKSNSNTLLKQCKSILINFTTSCISLTVGMIFPQLRQLSNLNNHLNYQYQQQQSLLQLQQQQDKQQYFTSLPSLINNRWLRLIQRMFESLLMEFIPGQLSPCVLDMYLGRNQYMKQKDYHVRYNYTHPSIIDDNNNNLIRQSQILSPYRPFFLVICSLFHYVCFMKKVTNIDDYYNTLSSCYMGLVQWPIVIANSHQFQLPIISNKMVQMSLKQQ